MFGAFLAAALTNGTVARQDRPAAGSDIVSRSERVLWVLRALMGYGRDLAGALQKRTGAFDLGQITCNFGTIDIARIMARIAHGLRLAAALEERLLALIAHPPAPRAASVRRPRVVPLDKPSAREAEAVVADICRYLGIVPADPLWPDITFAVLENGGSIIDLVMNTLRRMTQGVIEASPDVDFGPLPFAARYRVVSGAGPP